MCCCNCCDCILAFIAFFIPPLPVAIKRGCCSADLLINLALCLLGYVPGLIHSWYIILTSPGPVVDDLERQIYVVAPANGSQNVTINSPQAATVTFTHPEPFLESQNNSFSYGQGSSNQTRMLSPGPTSPAANSTQPNMSPLSMSPQTSSRSINQNYGAISEEPPSYDTVMDEAAARLQQSHAPPTDSKVQH